MGKLIINSGGAGVGSDDVTALKSHVLAGKTAVTNDSDDEAIAGTMPNVAAVDTAKSSVLSGGNMNIRMTYGAHITNTSSGYPEISMTQSTVASTIGLTAAKVLQGNTICQIAGTATSDGTIAAADVLSGKKAYSKGIAITGTMPNQGAKTSSLNCGGSYTIPAGYHNGSGKVTANALSGQTSGTATANNIIKGATAWVNGTKITGAMINWNGVPNHITNRRIANGRFEVAVDSGYHGCYWNGNSYEYMEYSEVASTLGLSAGNLAQGVVKCGLTGTYKGLGNATADKVLSGSTFSTASLSNAAGTMPNQGAKTSSLNCGGSYTIPAGYHNGSGKVTANSLSSQTSATATAGQIWTGKTAWVNGSKLTGTLATQGGSTTTPGTANKTIVSPNKIVTGNIVVAGDANLRAENILRGKTIFGVAGTAIYAGDTPGYFLEPPNEYVSLTGGWNHVKDTLVSTLEKGTTRYYFNFSCFTARAADTKTAYVRTVNNIDFSKYRYVYLDYENLYYTFTDKGTKFDNVSLYLEAGTSASTQIKITTTKQSGTLRLDISNHSSVKWLQLKVYVSWSNNNNQTTSQSSVAGYITIKAIRYDAI